MIPVIYWTGPEAGGTADMTDKRTIIKTVKKAPLLFFLTGGHKMVYQLPDKRINVKYLDEETVITTSYKKCQFHFCTGDTRVSPWPPPGGRSGALQTLRKDLAAVSDTTTRFCHDSTRPSVKSVPDPWTRLRSAQHAATVHLISLLRWTVLGFGGQLLLPLHLHHFVKLHCSSGIFHRWVALLPSLNTHK